GAGLDRLRLADLVPAGQAGLLAVLERLAEADRDRVAGLRGTHRPETGVHGHAAAQRFLVRRAGHRDARAGADALAAGQPRVARRDPEVEPAIAASLPLAGLMGPGDSRKIRDRV